MIKGSHIIAAGLSVVALLVSDKLGFPYTSAKFLGIVVTLLAATFCVFEKKLSFSQSNAKGVIFSFLGLFVFTIVSLALSKVGEHVTGISLVLLWALLAFSISALASHEGVLAFLKNLAMTQFPVIAFIYLYLLFDALFLNRTARPFFGNPNIVSNFLAVTLLQLFFIFKTEKRIYLRYLVVGFSVLGLSLLVYLQSRGSFLGLLVGGSVFSLLSSDFKLFIKKLSPNAKKSLGLATFVVIAALIFVLYRKGTDSLSFRYSFWNNTLCLIKDHPLGVGPGSFEYVFQHYNGKCYPSAEAAEGLQVRNPHNMFLEFFAEIGILGGLMFLSFLFFLFLELKKVRNKNTLAVSWVLGQAALLGTIGFFEFPQDTPYTLLFISVVFGIALALISSKPNPQSAYLRLINFSGAIVLAFVFFTKAYSDYLTVHPGKDPYTSYLSACALNNENWRGCVFLGLQYLEKDEYEKLDALIVELSKKFEGHHSLFHLKGTYALKRGDMSTACEEFKKYHLLFNRNTQKREFLEKNCPPLP